MNEIVRTNGQNPISNIDSIDFHAHYNDFQDNVKKVIGNTDATYGLKDTAVPWK